MIKNQLYPYIETYLNEYLHGFTKEQLDVGVMKGQIKLEKLNLRPDGVNAKMDEKNFPFWLKAGLIKNIYIGCSIMNFIGEKPLDVIIDGIDIILTPSYKWIIKNLDSFIIEDGIQMKDSYDPNENNSMDIFVRKVNVFDNSVFKKDIFFEIFKDDSKISQYINSFFKNCYKFYYTKNFSVNAKIKNLHIRFEDDQLINYIGNIAFGLRIDLLEINLSTEGVMKKDFFKVTKLDFYWENNAKILISSDLLNNSIRDGILEEKYYTNLKNIKFDEFNYLPGTKFIIENFNCNGRFGTKAINIGKMDLFNKSQNEFKVYFQFASNELNFNIFPDMLIIQNNFRKFMKEFGILDQVQEFKPMRKPYDSKNKNFIDIMKNIKENKNAKFSKMFLYKKKMMVRDWLFYFYWCQKCKSSIYGRTINPLRLEFSRFYNLCFIPEFNNDNLNLDNNSQPPLQNNNNENNDPNPDNVSLSLVCDLLIKGLNINIHPNVNSKNSEYTSLKISGVDIKLNLTKKQFDFQTNIKNINLSPNKLAMGEKIIISSNNIRKKEVQNNNNNPFKNTQNKNNNINKVISGNINSNNYNQIIPMRDVDENIGLNGLVKKFNPYYEQKLKIIDIALDKLSGGFKSSDSRSISEMEINYENNINNNNRNNNNIKNYNNFQERNSFYKETVIHNTKNKNDNNIKFIKKNTPKSPIHIPKNSNFCENFVNKNNKHQAPRNVSFAKQVLNNCEATLTVQKMEIKRQKNEINISQAINDYNNRKSRERFSIKNDLKKSNAMSENSFYKEKTKNENIIIQTGEIIPLNFIEIFSNIENNQSAKAFSFKFSKSNNEKNIDNLFCNIGTIRLNILTEYIYNFLNIFSDYKNLVNHPLIKSFREMDRGPKLEKKLFVMKKYIYDYIIKLPENKKNDQIKDYMKYLNKEIIKGKKLGFDSDNFEINYLFSLFPKGIEINFDYDNFECIYYNNIKKICGKFIIPPPEFHLNMDLNKVGIKLFDLELEMSELENTKYMMVKIIKILEEKLKMTKIFIEPCVAQLRNELEKNTDKKTIKDQNIKNILELAKDNYKKDTKEKESQGNIINYNNVFNIGNTNNNVENFVMNNNYNFKENNVVKDNDTLHENINEEEEEICSNDEESDVFEKLKIQQPNNNDTKNNLKNNNLGHIKYITKGNNEKFN